MSATSRAPKLFQLIFAGVWLMNGIYCKILDFVPRHRQIVSQILGPDHALFLTRLIGYSEIIMALWILSGIRWKWSCTAQIVAVATMNLIEFILVPELLLFGRFNALIALAYISLVAWVGYFRKQL